MTITGNFLLFLYCGHHHYTTIIHSFIYHFFLCLNSDRFQPNVATALQNLQFAYCPYVYAITSYKLQPQWLLRVFATSPAFHQHQLCPNTHLAVVTSLIEHVTTTSLGSRRSVVLNYYFLVIRYAVYKVSTVF